MADGIQIGNDHERMAEVSANALVQETESSSIQVGVDHERMAEIIIQIGVDHERMAAITIQIGVNHERMAEITIQIGVDHERMAEVSANEELAPTENDSAPRWLSKCPRGGTERGIQI